MTEFPIEVTEDNKDFIEQTIRTYSITCPDCGEVLRDIEIGETDYKHCETIMLKWT